jgi:hypothetical protein
MPRSHRNDWIGQVNQEGDGSRQGKPGPKCQRQTDRPSLALLFWRQSPGQQRDEYKVSTPRMISSADNVMKPAQICGSSSHSMSISP